MTTAQLSETRRTLALADLRTEFALRLASLYGTEVPAYNNLVDVSREVNQDFIAAHGADAERLGSIDRVALHEIEDLTIQSLGPSWRGCSTAYQA